MPALAHGLAHESEEHVGQTTQLDAIGVERGVVRVTKGVFGRSSQTFCVLVCPEERAEPDVGVAQGVVEVPEVLLPLVEAVVRDGGAEDQHEPDDAARHGVRRLREGQRALRVAHDVGAAPVNLERLRAQARDDREQDLREHAGQNRASHAEQRRDERPRAARVLERGNRRETREDATRRFFFQR